MVSYRVVLQAAFTHPTNVWLAMFNFFLCLALGILVVIGTAALVFHGGDAVHDMPQFWHVLWVGLEWIVALGILINWVGFLRGAAALNRPTSVLVPGWPRLLQRLLLAGWAGLSLLGSLLAGFDGGAIALYLWGILLALCMMWPDTWSNRSWNNFSVAIVIQLVLQQTFSRIEKMSVEFGSAMTQAVPLPVGLALMLATFLLARRMGFPQRGRARIAALDSENFKEAREPFLLRGHQRIEVLLRQRGLQTQSGEVMWQLVARDSLAVLPVVLALISVCAVLSLAIEFDLVTPSQRRSFVDIAVIGMAVAPMFQLASRVARQMGETRAEQGLYSLTPGRSGNAALAGVLLKRAWGTWLSFAVVTWIFLWAWRGNGGLFDLQRDASNTLVLFTAALLPLPACLKNYASAEQPVFTYNGVMIGAALFEMLVLLALNFQYPGSGAVFWIIGTLNAACALWFMWRRWRAMLRAPPPFPAWRMA